MVQCNIVNPSASERLDHYVALLCEKRKKKRLDPDQVRGFLSLVISFAGCISLCCCAAFC